MRARISRRRSESSNKARRSEVLHFVNRWRVLVGIEYLGFGFLGNRGHSVLNHSTGSRDDMSLAFAAASVRVG